MMCIVLTGHGLSAKGPPGGTRHRVNASVMQNASFSGPFIRAGFFIPLIQRGLQEDEQNTFCSIQCSLLKKLKLRRCCLIQHVEFLNPAAYSKAYTAVQLGQNG